MKTHYLKQEKHIYLPKEKPTLVDVPTYQYICIDGNGHPNDPSFEKKIQVLYSLSYAIKMALKKDELRSSMDYTVYPLEGLWHFSDTKKVLHVMDESEKDHFVYTLMIRQPDFITIEDFNHALEVCRKKKTLDFLESATFKSITDGLSVQMLHVGPYDLEHITFRQMHDFLDQNDLKVRTHLHREIYLSNPNRTALTSLKTVLRIMVEKTNSST